MHSSFKVEIQPEGRVVTVMSGASLIEAVGKAGVVLDMPCGGQGHCGKCVVQIVDDPPEPTPADTEVLDPKEIAEGFRLGCQTIVTSDMVVRIPDRARMFQQKILTAGVDREFALDPNITVKTVTVPVAELGDQRSDFDRLALALDGAVDGVWAELEVIRTLPAAIRNGENLVTVALEGNEVIGVDPGDTSEHVYGVAFDIGTTTIVGMLIDLKTGHQMAVSATTNPQVAFGDDVISRICHANEEEGGLKELHDSILDCVNERIADLAGQAKIDTNNIYEVTFAGNTTMNHILLGIDPRNIGEMPFVTAVRKAVNAKADRLGVKIRPGGNIYALPNIAGFVGGDTVGMVLSACLHCEDDLVLAIDIGTNGEIVLGSKNRIVCCSTAAGPAFEGARIEFGMRATDGAIDRVVINHDVELNVLGDAEPRGICGTGLIDAISEMLSKGIIEDTGRMCPADELPAGTSDAVRRRCVESEDGAQFILAHNGPEGKPVVLTQRDVRQVQLAKGAISAGATSLMAVMGVRPDDLHAVLLAGAFGNFIRRSQAKRIGLLPNVLNEKIRFIGNAAGTGSKMALASRHCRAEAEDISRKCEFIELATRPDFQMAFAEAMIFPAE